MNNRLNIWLAAGWLAALSIATAQAADPIEIAFTPATKKYIGSTVLWKVPAPSGANMSIKAQSGVLKQTAIVTLKWKGYQDTDQVFPTDPPGPGSVQLNASGQAVVPIVFGKGSHKQWYITACVKWQPPGYDHKIDDCVYTYLEGEDQIAMNAGQLIKIVSPAHPGLLHNWVKIPMHGNTMGVSVRDDVLAKSTDKVVRFKYMSSTSTTQPGNPWPAPTAKLTPKTISLSGAASQGGWTQKSEPLVPDPDMGEWLNVKACLTLEYSGEVCSDTYAYQLTKPTLKPGMDKNQTIDPSKQPSLPPPGSGGKAGQSGNQPAGNATMMAPPSILGAPAATTPAPAAPANPGSVAGTPQVPGCTALPGRTGEFSCAMPEAAAGCERLRALPTSGVRACLSSSGRLRR